MRNVPRDIRLRADLTPSNETRDRCQRLALDAVSGASRHPPEVVVARWAKLLHQRYAQSQPPFRLEPLLTQLNAEVKPILLSDGARLVYRANGSTILIKNDDPPCKQRFSIAHECAHIVFRKAIEQSIGDPVLQREVFRWGNSQRQERLCDRLAFELLLPRQWLGDVAKRSDGLRGMRLVTAIASTFDVTLQTALARLAQLGWPFLVIHWARASRPGSTEKLRTTWRWKPLGGDLPFIPPHRPVSPGSIVAKVHEDQKPRWGWQDFAMSGLGAQSYYFAEVFPCKSGVIGLIDLRLTENWLGSSDVGGKQELLAADDLLPAIHEIRSLNLRIDPIGRAKPTASSATGSV